MKIAPVHLLNGMVDAHDAARSVLDEGIELCIGEAQVVLVGLAAQAIRSTTVNISGAYSKLMAAVGAGLKNGTSEQTKVNLPPRLRMATLYAVAQSLPSGGRVVNTCNMSEGPFSSK